MISFLLRSLFPFPKVQKNKLMYGRRHEAGNDKFPCNDVKTKTGRGKITIEGL